MNMRWCLATLTAVGLFTAVPSQAQDKTTFRHLVVSDVTAILKEMGRPEAVDENQGDPRIRTSTKGDIPFDIDFYNCDDDDDHTKRKCTILLFTASFEGSKNLELFKAVNDYNAGTIFGRAYYGHDTVTLEHYTDVDGGVLKANVVDAVTVWMDMVEEFTDKLEDEELTPVERVVSSEDGSGSASDKP